MNDYEKKNELKTILFFSFITLSHYCWAFTGLVFPTAYENAVRKKFLPEEVPERL